MSNRLNDFTYPRLILCEGPHDDGFLRNLINNRRLKEFHIRHPNPETGRGVDGFRSALIGFQAITGYHLIRDLIVMADNDSDPQQSFQNVVDQIAAANLDAPNAPMTATAGTPRIHVIMVPGTGITGSLESLCYDAAVRNRQAAATCVDAFAACSGITNWPPQKLAKMKLRSFLASNHRRNPDVPFSKVWPQDPLLIPLSDQGFDPIASYLDLIP